MVILGCLVVGNVVDKVEKELYLIRGRMQHTHLTICALMQFSVYDFEKFEIFLWYRVIEVLAGGGCALVEWRLETGRTHQIRAHAKYLGIPLLGDDVYGGTKNMASSLLQSRNPSIHHEELLELVAQLERPCLHALTLGFRHPNTGENLSFTHAPPPHFAEALDQLRNIGTEKVTSLG